MKSLWFLMVVPAIFLAASSHAAESSNRVGLNGLSTNRVGLNGLSTNRVGLNGLSTNRVGLNGLATNRVGLNGISVNGARGEQALPLRDALRVLAGKPLAG
jgi:hypothetical protein